MIPVGGLSTRPALPLTGQLKTFMDTAVNGFVFVALGSNVKSLPQHVHDKFMKVFRKLKTLKFIFQYGEAQTVIKENVIFYPNWSPQNDLLGHRNTRVLVTQSLLHMQAIKMA